MNRTPMMDVMAVTKALADGQRVRILMLLQHGELCVCQIVEVLQLAASTVSKHLSILNAAGLVACRKDGRWAYYRLGDETGSAEDAMIAWLDKALCRDPDILKDRDVLFKVKKKNVEVLCRQQRKS